MVCIFKTVIRPSLLFYLYFPMFFLSFPTYSLFHHSVFIYPHKPLNFLKQGPSVSSKSINTKDTIKKVNSPRMRKKFL